MDPQEWAVVVAVLLSLFRRLSKRKPDALARVLASPSVVPFVLRTRRPVGWVHDCRSTNLKDFLDRW